MTTRDRLLNPSTPTPDSRPVDDLFDTLLREEFRSEAPPDLTAGVRAGWRRDGGRAATNRMLAASNATNPHRPQRWLAAALVLLGLGVVTATFCERDDADSHEPWPTAAASPLVAAPQEAQQHQEPQKKRVTPKTRKPQDPQPAERTATGEQGTVRLRVVDRHGGPVQDFELRVVRVFTDDSAPQQQPALRLPAQDRHVKPRDFVDDHVRIVGLAPASYRVIVAAAPHVRTVSPAFTVTTTGAPQQLTVALARGATITGVVRDAAGKPIANAEVRTGPDDAQARGPTPFQKIVRERFEPLHTAAAVKTDDAGRFRLTPLTPGRYSIVVSHADHCDHEQHGLRLLDGVERPLAVQLPRGTIVHGQASFGGEPRAGIRIRLVPLASSAKAKLLMRAHEAQTDADGKFRFSPLRPGSYKIQGSHQTERGNPFQVLLQLRATEQTLVLEVDQRELRCDIRVPPPR